ncbi:hypothetical protein COCC4DRAFT_36145 [Bipolaris maydis ATCC 48331]|uniref:Uncharacterized protein n=1 Tax=Cochliobolus heterostrophus (strain C4 / ATCC 48331 / race T) TaxID=665024 RepID=N4XM85_COCH4|nr:uncharacterized protein COCC4DRAFT_36145 [Bipolaris maydis ATCC 48331]KAH7563143.1 hypothetical protein BM1_00190 [Bipolaris maydis]ENI09758.1 hypothetical protein COCC4DRAFT_36145 [Bipolaris maydis ATCC 48331]KAJ5025300.1 hypothetical protein J3E73DRAFT_413293 [Bipolaris maydis]KAJ5063890.1 hypothetical protein J3E74DRAFT_443670 [Bipolaris maydis]KAJ6196959.1 hypothetical protein J3E72DRAFT_420402 [Bipolaris maydis]
MASSSRAIAAVDTVGLTGTDSDNITTPVTPTHRFRTRPLRNDSAESSLDAAAASPNRAYAHPCSHHDSANYPNALPNTPPLKPAQSRPRPVSPLGPANVRIRRSHRRSPLLHSPARAGHAARMRQLFEDASREQQTLQPAHVPYPQLPNISAKASSPLARPGHVHSHSQQATSPVRRLESLCIPTTLLPGPQPGFAKTSQQSSESWSDDSGYLIPGSRTKPSPKSIRASVLDDRISKWLTGVSTPNGHEPYAKLPQRSTHPRPQFCQRSSSNFSETASRSGRETLEAPLADTVTIRHVFHTRTEPTMHPATLLRSCPRAANHQALFPDPDLQLSPLSPNVCIERGPSRYHSSRNLRTAASPIKSPHVSKENAASTNTLPHHAQRDNSSTCAQVSPCKIGIGTRFQHPNHTSHTSRGIRTRHVDPQSSV